MELDGIRSGEDYRLLEQTEGNWIMADRLWLAFKALSSGKLIIVFGYRRPWEKE